MWEMILLFLIVVAGIFFALMRMLDTKFPPMSIFVLRKGTAKRYKFRELGEAIVEDNFMELLVGKYSFVGCKSDIDFYLEPNGKKLYIAEYRYGYLVGFKDKMPADKEGRPVISIDGKKTLSLGNGILVPLHVEAAKRTLTEFEVSKGKHIATKFIQSIRQSDAYNEKINPLLAALIANLPIFITGSFICLVVFIFMGQVAESVTALATAAAQIHEAQCAMGGC